jgi:hypothetical protein
MVTATVGESMAKWARGEASVGALIMIGSRVRTPTGPLAADGHSDWDFQVITSTPGAFSRREWVHQLGLGGSVIYASRTGRLGSATKVTVVLEVGELDLVVIPERRLRLAKYLVYLGLGRRMDVVKRSLTDLALVLRPGYQILKGEPAWGSFLKTVVSDFPPLRMSNREICAEAEAYVCDWLSTRHKIERGEFLAAQRWLHHQLAETNFRLLHELRQRREQLTLPDARRLESLMESPALVTVCAVPTRDSLLAATEKSAATLRELMQSLVGDAWRWPLTG